MPGPNLGALDAIPLTFPASTGYKKMELITNIIPATLGESMRLEVDIDKRDGVTRCCEIGEG